jgi:hypothetical protein
MMSGPIITAISIVALVGSIAGVLAIIWVEAKGDPEREAEVAARDYFSAHGHWPDEAP